MKDKITDLINDIKLNIIRNVSIDKRAVYKAAFLNVKVDNKALSEHDPEFRDKIDRTLRGLPILPTYLLDSFLLLIKTCREKDAFKFKPDNGYKNYIEALSNDYLDFEGNNRQVTARINFIIENAYLSPYNELRRFIENAQLSKEIQASLLKVDEVDEDDEGFSVIEAEIIEQLHSLIREDGERLTLQELDFLKNQLAAYDDDKANLPFLKILSDNICNFLGSDTFVRFGGKDLDMDHLYANCILAYQYCLKQCIKYPNLDKNFVTQFLQNVFQQHDYTELNAASEKEAMAYFDKCNPALPISKRLLIELNNILFQILGFIKSAWRYIKGIFIEHPTPITFAKNAFFAIDNLVVENAGKQDPENGRKKIDIFAIRMLFLCHIILYRYAQKALIKGKGNNHLNVISSEICSNIKSANDFILDSQEYEFYFSKEIISSDNYNEEGANYDHLEAKIKEITFPSTKDKVAEFCSKYFKYPNNENEEDKQLLYATENIQDFLEKNLKYLSPIAENSTEEVDLSKEDIEQLEYVKDFIDSHFLNIDRTKESKEKANYFGSDQYKQANKDYLAWLKGKETKEEETPEDEKAHDEWRKELDKINEEKAKEKELEEEQRIYELNLQENNGKEDLSKSTSESIKVNLNKEIEK